MKMKCFSVFNRFGDHIGFVYAISLADAQSEAKKEFREDFLRIEEGRKR